MNCQLSPLDIATVRPRDFIAGDCRQPIPPGCAYVDIPAYYVWSGVIAANSVLYDERQAFSSQTGFLLRGISAASPGTLTLYVRFQTAAGKWLSNVREPVDSAFLIGHQRRAIHGRAPWSRDDNDGLYFPPGSFIGLEPENRSGADIGAVFMFDGVLRYWVAKNGRPQ